MLPLQIRYSGCPFDSSELFYLLVWVFDIYFYFKFHIYCILVSPVSLIINRCLHEQLTHCLLALAAKSLGVKFMGRKCVIPIPLKLKFCI